MRVVSQSSDQLVLNEGSTSGIIVGSVFVVVGILAGYFLRPSTPYAIWIGLAIVVAGALVILFSSSITVTANRASGQVVYEKKRLIGGQTSNYAIADIFRIETRKQWQIQNAPQNNAPATPQLIAQSVIIFKDGRELALDHQKTSSSTSVGSVVLMGGQGAETAIAAQVAQFLNVPFQEIAPPNMPGMIQL